MSASLYLVAYDITDPRRLAQVARCLSRRAVRVQYSVFAAELTKQQREVLKADLQAIINPRTDDVRFYPVPASGDVVLLGRQLLSSRVLLLREGYNMFRLSTVENEGE